MPGKVNPVIPEAVTMVAAQVIGNDLTVTVAGQSGNFQLNVMLPVIAYNLLQSAALLSAACRVLADKAITGFRIDAARVAETLDRNPILVTAMNPVIGYEKGAAIAKTAYAEGRPIREVAREQTDLTDAELDRLLDPQELTRGGIRVESSARSRSLVEVAHHRVSARHRAGARYRARRARGLPACRSRSPVSCSADAGGRARPPDRARRSADRTPDPPHR
jgi:hypothetical protein